MSGSRGRGVGRRVAWCSCRGASGEDNKGCDKEYKNSFGTAHFASPIKSGSYLMRDNFMTPIIPLSPINTWRTGIFSFTLPGLMLRQYLRRSFFFYSSQFRS